MLNYCSQAMKSCDVDLSDSDTARLALRFDEEESRRVHIQKFMRFVRGMKSVAMYDKFEIMISCQTNGLL